MINYMLKYNIMDIKLIIGLGNPDKKYTNTYHNVGHLAINYLSKILDSRFQILVSNSYMNESGNFVAKALKKYGVRAESLLIIHDDSDIEIGKYKMDFGRGAAGHHGVESIQQHLKTNDFWRLRIGIRPPQKPDEARLKAEEFVLKKISPENKKILKRVFEDVVEKLNF